MNITIFNILTSDSFICLAYFLVCIGIFFGKIIKWKMVILNEVGEEDSVVVPASVVLSLGKMK